MRLKAEVTQPVARQTTMDHLESRHLFADKEHLLSLCEALSDDVRDGLALACAWRPLQDEAGTVLRGLDRHLLAGVRVENLEGIFDFNCSVQAGVVGEPPWNTESPCIPCQCPDERMLEDLISVGAQVLIHGDL